MFERAHHQRIAMILTCLDGELLRRHGCLFGGGTAIALLYGEYRQSLDVDFLVSGAEGYRKLRALLAHRADIAPIIRNGVVAPFRSREIRADQYGIRTMIEAGGAAIKFEIVREARIEFAAPGRVRLCGVSTLTRVDLAASKLLANSDRGLDDSTFNRDAIDLAAMAPRPALLRDAMKKAEGAYGTTVRRDLLRSLDRLSSREGWLDRCMHAMDVTLPRASLWQKLRNLRRALE